MALNSTATETQANGETGGGSSGLTPSGLRARGGQNVSRSYQRIDGLGELYPLATSHLTENIYNIAACLFKFEVSLWRTLDEAFLHFGHRYQNDYQAFISSFKEIWGNAFEPGSKIDLFAAQNESSATHPLRRIPDHEIPNLILDGRTNYFYGQLWELRHKLTQHAEVALDEVDTIPEQYRVQLSIVNFQQFSAYKTELRSSNIYTHASIVHESRNLLESIKAAAKAEELDKYLLKALKTKMTSLHEHYATACEQIGEGRKDLIDPLRTQWWNTEPQAEEPPQKTQPPADAVQAFETKLNQNSTLSFIVPIIALLACIPVALAWYKEPHEIGRPSDSDFYQLISNSIIQLLSLVTLIWPMLFHTRLARLAWFWTWILAGVSACMTVLALSLFLVVPTRWSDVLSFSGSVAQVLVVLQLVYTI